MIERTPELDKNQELNSATQTDTPQVNSSESSDAKEGTENSVEIDGGAQVTAAVVTYMASSS